MKSERNKTIDFDLSSGMNYLNKCIFDSKNNAYNLSNVKNNIFVGDTFEILDKMPHNFVDLLIVDPPYNLTKNYHGNVFKKTNNIKYMEFTEKWLKKCIPLLKADASIYVCCDWKSSQIIGNIIDKYFIIQNRITWQREKGRGSKNNWKNSMEDIWFATNSKTYTFNVENVKIRKKVIAPYKVNGKPKDWMKTSFGNYRDTFPSNFWNDITVPYWSMPENTAHPTQKPEKLYAKLILASSNENDVIFDPFSGSGTTAVVSKKLNRNYVCIEQNKQYCSWAQKRLEMAQQNNSIQGISNGVFWERNSLTEQMKKTKK